MNWSRDCARAASRCLQVVLLASLPAQLGCTHGDVGLYAASRQRAVLALFVPKLDLRWQLLQARIARSAGSDIDGRRVYTGIAVWLRWQPTFYAAQVPARSERSPAAWAAPCELTDVACFAELAESEREIGDALQQER